jgi:hypothetical protein
MLRNHFGWARRSAHAFSLLGVVSAFTLLMASSVFGGPLLGVSPIRLTPPTQSVTTTPGYAAPSSLSISGYVYVDSAGTGLKEPGEWGISGVSVELFNTYGDETVTTNSSGYYDFTNLTAGQYYAIVETQPSGFTPSAANAGTFISSSGSALSAPISPGNLPSQGSKVNDTQVNYLYLPLTNVSGFGSNSSGGQYALTNVNFGDVGKVTVNGNGSGTGTTIGKQPVRLGVPSGGNISTVGSASMSVSLNGVADSGRFLSGVSLNVSGAVANTASAPASTLNWNISATTPGVSVSPTSNSVVPGGSSPFTETINSSTLPLGVQTASITVSGNGSPSSVVKSLTIDPVLSRGIDSVSSSASTSSGIAFGRALIGQSYSQPLTITSTGSYANYTNLTVNAGTITNGIASLNNTTATTLNGTVTQANATLTITPTVTGTSATSANFGTTPFTGESLAAGSATLPTAAIPYTIDALEPRQLATVTGGFSSPLTFAVPANTGGYLYGANVTGSYTVTSTDPNPGPNNATMVNVGGNLVISATNSAAIDPVNNPTGTTGTVTAGTVVNSQNGTIPVTVNLQGVGQVSGSASLPITTAEAASVRDNTNYGSLPVGFNAANVAAAATGGTDPTNANNQLFGAPLIAAVGAGQDVLGGNGSVGEGQLTGLVAAVGSAGTLSTFNNSPGVVAVSATNYKGAVGTETDIIQSDVLPSGGTISMAYRARNNDENGNIANDGNTKLPAGVQWLTSDVVNINGLPSKTAIAVQMTFNPNINTYNEADSPPASVEGTYLLELEGSNWVRATSQVIPTANDKAFTAVNDTLYDFLTTYESTKNPLTGVDYTLDDLVGSWGVDTVNDESWAILNQGDVTLAVAPEPGTLALLAAGGISLFAWRMTRRRASAAEAVAATEAS